MLYNIIELSNVFSDSAYDKSRDLLAILRGISIGRDERKKPARLFTESYRPWKIKKSYKK